MQNSTTIESSPQNSKRVRSCKVNWDKFYMLLQVFQIVMLSPFLYLMCNRYKGICETPFTGNSGNQPLENPTGMIIIPQIICCLQSGI
jgi:hypothetical protein